MYLLRPSSLFLKFGYLKGRSQITSCIRWVRSRRICDSANTKFLFIWQEGEWGLSKNVFFPWRNKYRPLRYPLMPLMQWYSNSRILVCPTKIRLKYEFLGLQCNVVFKMAVNVLVVDGWKIQMPIFDLHFRIQSYPSPGDLFIFISIRL